MDEWEDLDLLEPAHITFIGAEHESFLQQPARGPRVLCNFMIDVLVDANAARTFNLDFFGSLLHDRAAKSITSRRVGNVVGHSRGFLWPADTHLTTQGHGVFPWAL